jgi:hypothetical protein
VQAAVDDLRAEDASASIRAEALFGPATAPAPRPSLAPGTRIRVQRGYQIIKGAVDESMPDGTMLWIWQDHGLGRLLVYPDEELIVHDE